MKKIAQIGVIATGLAVLLAPVAPAPSYATHDGSDVVINEIYTIGGSKAGVYPDFVELYNPTGQEIDLGGYTIVQASGKTGRVTQKVALNGKIAAGGYFLLSGADKQYPDQVLPSGVVPDQQINFRFAADRSIAALAGPNTNIPKMLEGDLKNAGYVDVVGLGYDAKAFESASASGKAYGTESFQRTNAKDTDNNEADFELAEATPTSSAMAAPSEPAPQPSEPENPPENTDEKQTEEAKTLTIEEIQGTEELSPYEGQTVTTQGVVTAAYPGGGFNGAYIQTAGSGGKIGESSSGIFVYGSDIANMQIGQLVKVTGKVTEYPAQQKDPKKRMTEIGGSVKAAPVDGEDFAAPEPVKLDKLPDTDEERERLEGMLVEITGPYTVTNNYTTARYGEVGLAPGDEPFRQPTDLYEDDSKDAKKLDASNKANLITLDDGASRETSVKSHKDGGYDVPEWPASYVDVKNPLRVGAHVKFKEPMILDYRFQWNLQPRYPVQEKTEDGFKDHSWDLIELTGNERPDAPGDFGAAVTISSFNVLNYFTDLGEAEEKCASYKDIEGTGVTTNNCKPRGAFSAGAFENQQAKIVEAITELDSSVVGLEEIENSARFGKDRDEALAKLTEALNAKAGSDKWAYVPSPQTVGNDEDVIRLAYIYQPDEVAPVGESQILVENKWFDGVARHPLAQKWSAIADGQQIGKQFVSVVNHFKSKGSVAKNPSVPGDNQTLAGNNNLLRVEQAKELTGWIKRTFPDDPVVILGDLNSYSKEDPVKEIEDAGYTSVTERFKVKNFSYQYDGLVGSLDHVLVNDAMLDFVTGADVWNVNAMEPIAFEYSRVKSTLLDPTRTFDRTAFRSSDHDPIKVGLDVASAPAPDVTEDKSELSWELLVGGGAALAGLVGLIMLLVIRHLAKRRKARRLQRRAR